MKEILKALVTYTYTRGPWTATPALIKVEERGQNQQTFIHAFFSKPHAIFWEKAQPVVAVV